MPAGARAGRGRTRVAYSPYAYGSRRGERAGRRARRKRALVAFIVALIRAEKAGNGRLVGATKTFAKTLSSRTAGNRRERRGSLPYEPVCIFLSLRTSSNNNEPVMCLHACAWIDEVLTSFASSTHTWRNIRGSSSLRRIEQKTSSVSEP
ncbi:hypothetical protein KC331_g45 [Hortaea werneckii]|nr:hypothetical protein KC331_g45 [Hortaea werneckii]